MQHDGRITTPPRPLSDIPSVDEVGAWALTHWIDSPSVTITTNRGESRKEFIPANARQRTGVPYVFELLYLLRLMQADQGNAALQQQIRRNDATP